MSWYLCGSGFRVEKAPSIATAAIDSWTFRAATMVLIDLSMVDTLVLKQALVILDYSLVRAVYISSLDHM
jgi:hypothetical protein